MSLPVFSAVLDHLYTDSVDVPPELALPLFSAANFFQIDRLKSLCAARIEADLAISNCCHALTIADQHCAAELKEVCISFIVTAFKAVHNTDGFKQLSRSLLEVVHEAISERMFAGQDAAMGSPAPERGMGDAAGALGELSMRGRLPL